MYVLLGLDNIWLRCNYLKIWNLRVQKKNLNIEKIAFKVVQKKFLAILTFLLTLQNIFMEHDFYLIS